MRYESLLPLAHPIAADLSYAASSEPESTLRALMAVAAVIAKKHGIPSEKLEATLFEFSRNEPASLMVSILSMLEPRVLQNQHQKRTSRPIPDGYAPCPDSQDAVPEWNELHKADDTFDTGRYLERDKTVKS